MGTPNSTIPEQALEDYLLGGVTPELRVLCALGMDVKLLKNRYEAIKPQLPYLEGYTMLESACEHVRDRTKTWKDLVNEAKLTGTKVIRFAFLVNTFNAPILSLYPVGNGGYGRDIEVFLVRNGDWLIWDGGDFPETPPRFIRHRTAELAVDRLREIGGNQHEFFSSHYQELRYWPFPGHRLNNGRCGEKQSVALVLAKHLSWLLQTSIAAKKSRLLTQTNLLDTFEKVDRRNGLSA